MQIGQCRIETFRLAQDTVQNSLFIRIESQELLADVGQCRIGIWTCFRSFCDVPALRIPLHVVPFGTSQLIALGDSHIPAPAGPLNS